MANWNIKEITGRQYVYVSKNAVSDVAAANYFGKAAAWVSLASYAVGDRVTSSSIQYRNKTGVNTTTAPASDATNWEFDFENYQTYSTSRSYLVGHKTNYNNEHYICITNTSGTFNPAHWNKVIISNRDVPYKLMNTAVNLINGDARFVSFEELDYTNNIAYHNIYCVLSNGIWNETLTNPTKYIRFVGQSNVKTKLSTSIGGYTGVLSGSFIDNLGGIVIQGLYSRENILKLNNCIIESVSADSYNASFLKFAFSFKNVFKTIVGSDINYPNTYYHFVNNNVINFVSNCNVFTTNTVFKNNYLKATTIALGTLIQLQKIPMGNMDYNYYEGTITVGGVTQATIAALQATLPNQNIYSIKGTATLNSDYTLPSGSALLGVGSNGNNIGAEGRGYVDTKDTIFSTSNGAIYRNLKVTGTYIERDQISKQAQANSGGNMILNSSASSTNEEYTGFRIYISTGTGAGQTRTIASYNGSTKAITVTEAWTTLPDATSIYEILDGELTSGIGDLGSVQTVRKMLFNNIQVYKADQLTIDQAVSITDPRLDKPSGMTYDLKVSNASDLGGASFVRFAQDEEFKIDANGKGCGSEDYNASTVASNTLTFRYYQVKLYFRK